MTKRSRLVGLVATAFALTLTVGKPAFAAEGNV